MITHAHTPKSSRTILGNNLYECSCGARKWSNDRPIIGGVLDAQGWYIPEEPIESPLEARRRRAIELLETEGYGYDYNRPEAQDQYDGGRGAGSLGQPID